MPILSADNASSVVTEPTVTEEHFDPAEISLPSHSVNPDPRVSELFNRGGTTTVDLFSNDGLSGPRDGDPVMRGHWAVASEMLHVDETNIADALNAVNQVTSGDTNLNTTAEQKDFLTNHYSLQEQTLERALHTMVRSYDQTSPNPNALEDNFNNLRSRYITAFAASPEDVERMEEMFDHLEDALLSNNEATRSAAARTLIDRADVLDLPPGIENALQQDGAGRFNSFIRAMENHVERQMNEKREQLDLQATNIEEALYRELSRTSNNLAADYIIQSHFSLTDEQEQQLVDILHSGDPSALQSAITHLRTFNPDAAESMEALQMQQTYLDARFGPADSRDAALSSLRTQLGVAADLSASETLELAQQRLPAAVTREVIGSLGQDQDGVQQIAGEYAQIPMRQRVLQLDQIINEVRNGSLEGTALVDRLQPIYAGLSSSQAMDLNLEYQRAHNSELPLTMISEQVNIMDYHTRTLVENIMSGVDPTRYASLITNLRSNGSSQDLQALNTLMGMTTGAQREQALESMKPLMRLLDQSGTPTEWLQGSLIQTATPIISQNLPGFRNSSPTTALASYQVLHEDLMDTLNQVNPDTASTPITNEDRAAARTAIERKLRDATEDQLTMLFSDQPEITRIMSERLVDNPDHPIAGENPPRTTRQATLSLIGTIANIPDIESLRTNLTYDAAHPERHTEAIETLNALRSGNLGQQQLAVINEVLQTDPAGATSLNALARTYLQAHPSLSQDQRVDLLLASYGMDPNAAVSRLGSPATGNGSLTINELVQSMNNIPTTLEDRVQAALDREKAERAQNNLAAWTPVEEAARRTELTNEIRVAEYTGIEDLQNTNLRELYALRVASLYQATHSESITTQFPVDDTERSVLYQQFFGTELGSNILNSGNRVTSVLTQYSPGNDLDDSLYRSLRQARAVAEAYGTNAPGGTADPNAAGYGDQPANGSQLMAQMQRDLFVQEFRNQVAYANGGTSLHDLMHTTVQSGWWSGQQITARTLGIDFSDLNRTETQLGHAIDEQFATLSTELSNSTGATVNLRPSHIATEIRNGNYSLEQFNQDREKITDPVLRQQFAFRVAEHYRRSYDSMTPDQRTGNTSIVELEKIRLPNNTEHHRQALLASFYGEEYANSFQALREEYQELLQNDSATPEQYHRFFESIPDITLFRRNYDYVTGNNLRDQLAGEFTAQEKTTFNTLYRLHISHLGGAL